MSRGALKCVAFVLATLTLLIVLSLAVVASPESGSLLEASGGDDAVNTANAFYDACLGSEYGGVKLVGDYGHFGLTVSIIRNGSDGFIIDLNGHTLTLGFLAVNIDLTVKGEGEIRVKDGIVIYAGDLHIESGVSLVADSPAAIVNYGESSQVHIGRDVEMRLNDGAVAEIAVMRENDGVCPLYFSDIVDPPVGSGDPNAVAGKDYYRVLYGDPNRPIESVSSTYVAQFADLADTTVALERGFVKVINPLQSDQADGDDGIRLRAVGSKLIIGKLGAVLSYVTISLESGIELSFYFDLSETDVEQSALGRFEYSGVGNGGAIDVPSKAEENGLYKFSVPIGATELDKTVTVGFSEFGGRVWDYSVTRYARYILGAGAVNGSELNDLVASMFRYGATVQRYNGLTEGAVDQVLLEFPPYNRDTVIQTKIASAVEAAESLYDRGSILYTDGKENSPIVVYGMSLAVSDTVSIKLHFKDGYAGDGRYGYYLIDSEQDPNEVDYGGVTEMDIDEISENGYLTVSDIPLSDFGETKRVVIRDKTENEIIAVCDVSVIGYALRLMDASSDGSIERDLAESIIWYAMSGAAYFG